MQKLKKIAPLLLAFSYSISFCVAAIRQSPQGEKVPKPEFTIPRAAKPPRTACDAGGWEHVPFILLMPNDSQLLGGFVKDEVVAPIEQLPSGSGVDLQGFMARYRFLWDENNLYALVEVRDPKLDNQHPFYKKSEIFKGPVAGVILPDIGYDTVSVIVAAPRWDGRNTEMYLNVRPPGAKAPAWVFWGRTVDEEYFHELKGRAVSCAAPGGYSIRLELAWLTSQQWKPRAGAEAELRIFAFLSDTPERKLEERQDKLVALMKSVRVTLASQEPIQSQP